MKEDRVSERFNVLLSEMAKGVPAKTKKPKARTSAQAGDVGLVFRKLVFG
jgi:hypothetical protein